MYNLTRNKYCAVDRHQGKQQQQVAMTTANDSFDDNDVDTAALTSRSDSSWTSRAMRPKSAGRVRSGHVMSRPNNGIITTTSITNGGGGDGGIVLLQQQRPGGQDYYHQQQDGFKALRSCLSREQTFVAPSTVAAVVAEQRNATNQPRPTSPASTVVTSRTGSSGSSGTNFADDAESDWSGSQQRTRSDSRAERPKSAKGRHRDVRRLHSDSILLADNAQGQGYSNSYVDTADSHALVTRLSLGGGGLDESSYLQQYHQQQHAAGGTLNNHHGSMVPPLGLGEGEMDGGEEGGALLRVYDRALASGRKVVEKCRRRSMSDSMEEGEGGLGGVLAPDRGAAGAGITDNGGGTRTHRTSSMSAVNWNKVAYRKPPTKLQPLVLDQRR